VAYAIIPSNTNKLSTIAIVGKAPSFLSVQSATSLNNKIVVYTVNNSVASMNVFDAVSSTWSGPGLIGSGTSKPISSPNENNGKRFPVAPVVGGIFALAVVVWTVYWTTRNCRRRQKNQADNNNGGKDEGELPTQKLEMDPQQQKHSILTLQEEAVSSPQQQQQQHATCYTSIHTAPFNVHPHSAPRVPPAPLPREDYMSDPQPPYNPQYMQSVQSNPQYRDEEEPLGWI
jgi:hypothetical protein